VLKDIEVNEDYKGNKSIDSNKDIESIRALRVLKEDG
jgi:hypothetical protein